MSSRPCVGCAWRPSPALITATPGLHVARDEVRRARLRVAHDEHVGLHRRQVRDGVEQRLALGRSTRRRSLRLMTSADRRLAAISKVVRVRVEGSKNRLKIALPRSSGTFFTSRSDTETNWSAVSRMRRIIAAGSPSMVSRWCSSPSASSCRLAGTCSCGPASRRRSAAVRSRSRAPAPRRRPPPPSRRRSLRAIGSSRPPRSTSTARRTARGPAEVEQLVHRGADRAAGVEHVVDQHQLAAVDVERDLAAARLAVQADAAEVVAMQGDGEQAERHRGAERAVQALGEPRAAGVDADERRRRARAAPRICVGKRRAPASPDRAARSRRLVGPAGRRGSSAG